MTQKLTREQAIIEHRKMWNWIADQLDTDKGKKGVYELKRKYCEENDFDLLNHCFLCDYTWQNCENCPLYWGAEREEEYTFCEPIDDKEYTSWLKADKLSLTNIQKATEIARQIANLPEKVYFNKACGNIHFTYEEMMKEAAELYDLDDDSNILDWREYYEVKPLL